MISKSDEQKLVFYVISCVKIQRCVDLIKHQFVCSFALYISIYL